MLLQQAVKREALYTEFIVEASRRFVEAWGHQAEDPEVVAGLYAVVERMRLTSPDEIIRPDPDLGQKRPGWCHPLHAVALGCAAGEESGAQATR